MTDKPIEAGAVGAVVHRSRVRGGRTSYPRQVIIEAMAKTGHAYAIRVSAEDYGRLDDEHWITGQSVSDVIQAAKEWEAANIFERWHFCGGDIMDATGCVHGIAHNLRRVCPVSSTGNDCYEKLPDFEQSISIEQACSTPIPLWFSQPAG